MHAPWRGGREPRRAEKRSRSRSRAESSRVESRRAVAPAHAPLPPTPTRACVLLLARSLAKLTRASEERENAGEQIGQEYLRYVIHWRGDRAPTVCLRRGPAAAGSRSRAVAAVRYGLPASSREQRITDQCPAESSPFLHATASQWWRRWCSDS